MNEDKLPCGHPESMLVDDPLGDREDSKRCHVCALEAEVSALRIMLEAEKKEVRRVRAILVQRSLGTHEVGP